MGETQGVSRSGGPARATTAASLGERPEEPSAHSLANLELPRIWNWRKGRIKLDGMRPALVLSLLLLFGTAIAAPPAQPSAPVPKEVTSEEMLFAQLKKSESAEDAHAIEQKLQAMFRASGSPSVDLLIIRAQAAEAATDSKTAKQLIDAVTNIAPNYAEGWHIRATMEQAAGDDTAALVSLQKVVLLNPRQFTALTELAAMLEDYGDKAAALKLYRRALELDPQMEIANRKVRELTQSVEGRDI